MKAKNCLAALALTLLALPVFGQDPLAGNVFKVDILRYGETEWVSSCMTFEKDGGFVLGRAALKMVWNRPDDQPDTFATITDLNDDLYAPYQLATHGLVISGEVLLGASIDQNGNTMAFIGSPDANCLIPDAEDDAQANAAPANLCLQTEMISGTKPTQALANCAPAPYLDPASGVYTPSFAPCDAGHCDPIADPLRAEEDKWSISKLRDRSFVVSMEGSKAAASCWTFGSDGNLHSPSAGTMAWAPDDLWDLTSTFQAVSQGSGGIGKAYYGELFDDTLEVRGIEADAGVSRAIRGVGHEVTSCKSL